MKKLKTVDSFPSAPELKDGYHYYDKSATLVLHQRNGVWVESSPFFVNPVGQTITFYELPNQRSDASSLALMASSSSGLPVSYSSSNTAVATINGSVVNFVSHGNTVITASQAGDALFSAAADVSRMLLIVDINQDSDGDGIPDVDDPYPNSQAQTITFAGIADRAVIDGNLTLNATASSGLPVTYSTTDTNLLTINPGDPVTVSFVGTGSIFTQQVSITASQSGGVDSNGLNDWKSAPDVQQAFDLSDLDSDGDGIPDSTDPYPNSQTQTITFGTIANREVVDGNLTLSATSSSALPVTYSTPDTNLLTINGNVVSFTGTGSVFTQQVSITASQAGGYNSANSTDWKAASPVQKTFDLSDLDGDGDGIPDSTDSNPNTTAQTITFPTIGSINRSTNTYALNATSTSSVPITYSSLNTSVATVSGSTLTFVANSGTATITANQAANDDFFAATASQSLTIIDDLIDTDQDGIPDISDPWPNQQAHTVTFAGDQNPVYYPGAIGTIQDVTMPADGGPFPGYITLYGSSDFPAGYPRPSLTWASSDTAVASFDNGATGYEGNELFIHTAGTVTITLSWSGSEKYLPVPDQSITFTIHPSSCDSLTAVTNSIVPNTEWFYTETLTDDESGNFQVIIPGYAGANGSITAAGSGGVGPWTFTWTLPDGSTVGPTSNPQLGSPTYGQGIPAGSYGLIITDSAGCTASASGTVPENSVNLCPLNRVTISHTIDQWGRLVTQITGHELSSNSTMPNQAGPFTVKAYNITNLPANPTAMDLNNAEVFSYSTYEDAFTTVIPSLPAGDYLYEVQEDLHSPQCKYAEIVTIP